VTPIHAERSEIQAYRTAPSIEAIDHTPDLAIVALPGELAIDSVRRCAKAVYRGHHSRWFNLVSVVTLPRIADEGAISRGSC